MQALGQKAQVSLEYLLTLALGIGLVVAISMLIMNMRSVALQAQAKVLQSREETIASLMG